MKLPFYNLEVNLSKWALVDSGQYSQTLLPLTSTISKGREEDQSGSYKLLGSWYRSHTTRRVIKLLLETPKEESHY